MTVVAARGRANSHVLVGLKPLTVFGMVICRSYPNKRLSCAMMRTGRDSNERATSASMLNNVNA